MKKMISFLLLAELMSIKVIAQIISFDSGFDENRLKIRVELLDEFISRFNYEKDVLGNSVENKQDMEMRKKYVYSLFNEDLFKDFDNELPKSYEDFVNTVTNIKQPAYIYFTDTDWLAQADCKAMYNGKQIELTVFLRIEHIEGYKYKWVIIGLKNPLLSLNPDKQNPGIIISPTDNELRFMNLPDLSGKNHRNIINYSPKEYTVDKLTVFNALVYTGQLKIEYVKKVNYLFFQIPGYVFKVEHFERDRDNAGWLISEIQEIKESEKPKYWNEIVNN